MISSVHFLLYSKDANADRRFLRDVLGFSGIDAGEGWLIFALPPCEMAVHPAARTFAQKHAGHDLLGAVVYLMCRDLAKTMSALEAKGAEMTEVQRADWGVTTTIRLPGGGELGLYEPFHPVAARQSARPRRRPARKGGRQ
jgi:hypothetical protein